MILREGWSADVLLEPHNEHPYLAPIAIYKLLLELFGMGSTLPFQIVNVALLISVAYLTMVLVRRRLGSLAGLGAAALLLFMGASWENLLWPAGISFLGSTAAGLGALALLESGQRPRDGLVCALLVASLCCSSLGLVFAFGVGVELVLRAAEANRSRLARLWVPAVPIGLYLAWYLGYGSDAESATSLDNLLGIPLYMWTAASSAMASLLGLVEVDPENFGAVVSFDWGKPLLIAGLIGAGLLLAREPGAASARLWALAATSAAFWASAGLNQVPGREPGASRYQLIGGVLVLLLGSELMRGRRPSRPALAAGALVVLLAVVSSIGALRDGERFLRAQSDTARADLTALELVRDRVDPGLQLTEEVAGTPFLAPVVAGPYFEAVDEFGSPVAVPDDLLEASGEDRARAEGLLEAAAGITLEQALAGQPEDQ